VGFACRPRRQIDYHVGSVKGRGGRGRRMEGGVSDVNPGTIAREETKASFSVDYHRGG